MPLCLIYVILAMSVLCACWARILAMELLPQPRSGTLKVPRNVSESLQVILTVRELCENTEEDSHNLPGLADCVVACCRLVG